MQADKNFQRCVSAVKLDFRFFFAYALRGGFFGPPLEKPKEERICI